MAREAITVTIRGPTDVAKLKQIATDVWGQLVRAEGGGRGPLAIKITAPMTDAQREELTAHVNLLISGQNEDGRTA